MKVGEKFLVTDGYRRWVEIRRTRKGLAVYQWSVVLGERTGVLTHLPQAAVEWSIGFSLDKLDLQYDIENGIPIAEHVLDMVKTMPDRRLLRKGYRVGFFGG
jgi:hypothetical protein